MEFFKEAKLGLMSLRLQRDPSNTGLIFEIIQTAVELQKNQKSVEQVESSLLQHKNFKKAWENRWMANPLKKADLANMPKDSLGHTYNLHLEINNLNLAFYKNPRVHRVIDYLSYRLYNAHDIWHTLLAYDVSVIGELELQAFTVGQIDSPASIFLISGGLYNIVRTKPEVSREAFEKVNLAFQRGKKAKFLLDVQIEDRLMENLDSIRAELGSE